MVHIYEDFPAGTWRLFRSVLPGAGIAFDRPGNRLKFEVPDRELIAATNVQGGYDLQFDGAQVVVRIL